MSKAFFSFDDPVLLAQLRSGAVGVLPTDTVYGLVCCAADKEGVERLYKLKKRENKPGTLIAASTEQLAELGIKNRYLKAVEHFWPGAVSVVVPAPELTYLHRGKSSLAVRIPDNADLLELLEKTGPLQTTSANLVNEPLAHTVAEAEDYFGDKVDFYVDGGDLSGRKESTVLRVVDDAIEILRQGAVRIDENGRVTERDI